MKVPKLSKLQKWLRDLRIADFDVKVERARLKRRRPLVIAASLLRNRQNFSGGFKMAEIPRHCRWAINLIEMTRWARCLNSLNTEGKETA